MEAHRRQGSERSQRAGPRTEPVRAAATRRTTAGGEAALRAYGRQGCERRQRGGLQTAGERSVATTPITDDRAASSDNVKAMDSRGASDGNVEDHGRRRSGLEDL